MTEENRLLDYLTHMHGYFSVKDAKRLLDAPLSPCGRGVGGEGNGQDFHTRGCLLKVMSVEINLDTVWETVQTALPELLRQLQVLPREASR